MSKYRTGRKLGRTIYMGDVLIGMMDSPVIAATVVEALNQRDWMESHSGEGYVSARNPEYPELFKPHPEPCVMCERNITWFTPSPVWNKTCRGDHGPDPGILCPMCFVNRYEEKFGEATWILRPEFVEVGFVALAEMEG